MRKYREFYYVTKLFHYIKINKTLQKALLLLYNNNIIIVYK